MKTEQKKVNLYVSAVKWFSDDFELSVTTHKKTSDETQTVILLSKVEVEIEVPLLNNELLVPLEIKQLEKIREQIKMDAFNKAMKIDDQIKNLLALTSK